jgi:hypothetical protein
LITTVPLLSFAASSVIVVTTKSADSELFGDHDVSNFSETSADAGDSPNGTVNAAAAKADNQRDPMWRRMRFLPDRLARIDLAVPRASSCLRQQR